MPDYLNSSGTLTLGGTNIATAINALFNRGNNLGAYRGTVWWKADNTTGNFPTGAISISDFYGKGPEPPILPPIITSFTVSNSSPGPGDIVTFSGTYNTDPLRAPDSVRIDQGVGSVPFGGGSFSINVNVGSTLGPRTFTVRLANVAGVVTQPLTINIVWPGLTDTTPGTRTWTVPFTGTFVVTCIGAGGYGSAWPFCASGGGGGGGAQSTLTLTEGTVISYTVGDPTLFYFQNGTQQPSPSDDQVYWAGDTIFGTQVQAQGGVHGGALRGSRGYAGIGGVGRIGDILGTGGRGYTSDCRSGCGANFGAFIGQQADTAGTPATTLGGGGGGSVNDCFGSGLNVPTAGAGRGGAGGTRNGNGVTPGGGGGGGQPGFGRGGNGGLYITMA